MIWIKLKTLMARIDDSYCQYIEGTHPFLCWWIPQQYLTLWTLAHVRDVSGSKENINIIWFIFGFVICVLTVGKVCNFLCALQFWFSDHPARIKYGSFPMAHRGCFPKECAHPSLILVFSKIYNCEVLNPGSVVVYHDIHMSSTLHSTNTFRLLWSLFYHSFLISWLSTLYID